MTTDIYQPNRNPSLRQLQLQTYRTTQFILNAADSEFLTYMDQLFKIEETSRMNTIKVPRGASINTLAHLFAGTHMTISDVETSRHHLGSSSDLTTCTTTLTFQFPAQPHLITPPPIVHFHITTKSTYGAIPNFEFLTYKGLHRDLIWTLFRQRLRIEQDHPIYGKDRIIKASPQLLAEPTGFYKITHSHNESVLFQQLPEDVEFFPYHPQIGHPHNWVTNKPEPLRIPFTATGLETAPLCICGITQTLTYPGHKIPIPPSFYSSEISHHPCGVPPPHLYSSNWTLPYLRLLGLTTTQAAVFEWWKQLYPRLLHNNNTIPTEQTPHYYMQEARFSTQTWDTTTICPNSKRRLITFVTQQYVDKISKKPTVTTYNDLTYITVSYNPQCSY